MMGLEMFEGRLFCFLWFGVWCNCDGVGSVVMCLSSFLVVMVSVCCVLLLFWL